MGGGRSGRNVTTILQLWTKGRIRLLESQPRVWVGLAMVDYPSLKKLELFLRLQRIGVHMSGELLKGSCNIGCRRGEEKRREEKRRGQISSRYSVHDS